MYIEDILDNLMGIGQYLMGKSPATYFNSYDSKFLNSFNDQIITGNSLTEKQRNLCLAILRRYGSKISSHLQKDVQPYLDNPQWKYSVRTINKNKKISLMDTDDKRRLMRLEFPYDESFVDNIKTYNKIYQSNNHKFHPYAKNVDIQWNPQLKSWTFALKEDHLKWLRDNFPASEYTYDQEILDFFEQIDKIQKNVENFLPMVKFDGNSYQFVNVHYRIPQPTSTDVVEVLFQAKKYGIFYWDEHTDINLQKSSTPEFVKIFLKNDYLAKDTLEFPNYTIQDICTLFKYLKNIIIIIPDHDHLKYLNQIFNQLVHFGYTSEQMAVLFRLNSSSGADCNEFIKSYNLNNPITEKINFFFISGKVPKPLISEKIEIDAIINLGSGSSHYTQRNLLRNHHCVINFFM